MRKAFAILSLLGLVFVFAGCVSENQPTSSSNNVDDIIDANEKAKETPVKPKNTSPTCVEGTGNYDCPEGYPIKCNDSSSGEFIYHIPSGNWYSRTKPEWCCKSESDAVNKGYRASKN